MKPQVQIDAQLVNFSTKLANAKQLMRLVFRWLRARQPSPEIDGFDDRGFAPKSLPLACEAGACLKPGV